LKGAQCWISAVFVSVLRGPWHLPVSGIAAGTNIGQVLFRLLPVHLGIGVLLSIVARQSGTLVLPAGVHALLDAWRNAVGLGG
jgi:membrane protease YdiL (CAAX protease family)